MAMTFLKGAFFAFILGASLNHMIGEVLKMPDNFFLRLGFTALLSLIALAVFLAFTILQEQPK